MERNSLGRRQRILSIGRRLPPNGKFILLCVLCVSVVRELDGIGRAPFEDGASVMGRFTGVADFPAVIDEGV
jgi:hypothetical protein